MHLAIANDGEWNGKIKILLPSIYYSILYEIFRSIYLSQAKKSLWHKSVHFKGAIHFSDSFLIFVLSQTCLHVKMKHYSSGDSSIIIFFLVTHFLSSIDVHVISYHKPVRFAIVKNIFSSPIDSSISPLMCFFITFFSTSLSIFILLANRIG